jgi:hypothetical protein
VSKRPTRDVVRATAGRILSILTATARSLRHHSCILREVTIVAGVLAGVVVWPAPLTPREPLSQACRQICLGARMAGLHFLFGNPRCIPHIQHHPPPDILIGHSLVSPTLSSHRRTKSNTIVLTPQQPPRPTSSATPERHAAEKSPAQYARQMNVE